MLCDVVQDDHKLAPHAPRSILQNQVKAAQEVGAFKPMAASELEYFLYKDTYEEAKVISSLLLSNLLITKSWHIIQHFSVQNNGYMKLKPAGWVREDYHIFQGTRGEYFHGTYAANSFAT